jgi:site-specific DNA-cytosine methylase
MIVARHFARCNLKKLTQRHLALRMCTGMSTPMASGLNRRRPRAMKSSPKAQSSSSLSLESEIPPNALTDGTLLDRLAEAQCSVFENMLPKGTALAPELQLTWGSICSGGEVDAFCFRSLSDSYQSRGIKVTFKHAFSCEIQKKLHNWITEVLTACDDEGGCLFHRAEDMGKDIAMCAKHQKLCPVPDADIVISGTSCKDISKASNVYKARDMVLSGAMESSVGGSVQTFMGLIAYLDKHVVSILLFENVDSLDDAGDQVSDSNLDVACRQLAEVGFSLLSLLTDSKLFNLPQSRRRYYIVGLKDIAPPFFDFTKTDVKEVFALVQKYVGACQREPPCASLVLLSEDSFPVENELNRRLSAGAKHTQYNVSASITHFQGCGLRWGDVTVEDSFIKTPWYVTLASLQKNVLTFSLASQPGVVLCRDIGQSSARVRHSTVGENGKHIAYCQMPGQVTWLQVPGGVPRLQLGRESLMLQGYPIARITDLVGKTSERQMQEIAGNMMAAPIPLAILQALMAALPWRVATSSASAPSHSTADDVELAWSSFGIVTNAPAHPPAGGPIAAACSATKFRRIRRSA